MSTKHRFMVTFDDAAILIQRGAQQSGRKFKFCHITDPHTQVVVWQQGDPIDIIHTEQEIRDSIRTFVGVDGHGYIVRNADGTLERIEG